MSRIVLITSLTENYQRQAQRLLSSLRLLKVVEPYVMTLDFNLPDGEGYRCIRVPDMNLPLPTCPQQGQLVGLVPHLADDDIVIMADADACVQRDLLSDEIYLLNNLGNRVGVSDNASSNQNAISESVICQPKVPLVEVEGRIGLKLTEIPIYNCGFIAAKPPTWRKINKQFDETWAVMSPMFSEWRCCQLVLCTAFKLAGIEILNLGYGLHTQGHFKPLKLHDIHEGVLYYGNRPVFFVHHVRGFW